MGTYTITSLYLPVVLLCFTDAGRIKQRLICCRKIIIIFGSSDLFIEQLLAGAMLSVGSLSIASGYGRNIASFPN